MELFQAHTVSSPAAQEISNGNAAIPDRGFRCWLLAALACFLALRGTALFLIPPGYDEMVQLYMGRDIAGGLRFPLYFYGQQYMGPLESYVIAPFFRLFGFSVVLGRFVYEIFYIAFAILSLNIARRLFDWRVAATLGVLLAVLPFPILYYTVIVGFTEIFALSLVCLWLLLKLADKPQKASPAFWLGFVSSLGFWCYPMFMVWFPAIGACLCLLGPKTARQRLVLTAFGGFLAGLFPIALHGLLTGTFLIMDAGGESSTPIGALPRMLYLFFARLKYFLGTNVYEAGRPLRAVAVSALSWWNFSLFAVAGISYAISGFHNFRRAGTPHRFLYLFLLLPVPALLVLYCSRDLAASHALRYFLPLTATYLFAVSWWIGRLRHAMLRRAVLGSLVLSLLTCTLLGFESEARLSRFYRQTIALLEKNGLRCGVADFSLAYTIPGMSDAIRMLPLASDWRNLPIDPGMRLGQAQFILLLNSDTAWREKWEGNTRLQKTALGNYTLYSGPPRDIQAPLKRLLAQ